ncbi:MAG: hypothetical protein NVSMB13_01000 [Mycobacteriales bacterium]
MTAASTPAGDIVAGEHATETAAAGSERGGRATLEAVHERLTAAVADLSNGRAWQQMLTTAARFHHYSPQNVLLIAVQCPQASAVAGFHTWRQLGRQVRKGERGIAILAPMLRRSTPAQTQDRPGLGSTAIPVVSPDQATPSEAGARRLAGFRVVHVFDIAQTDGPDLPTGPSPVLLDGHAPAGLYDGLAQQVRDLGYGLIRHELAIPHMGGGDGRPNGVTDFFAKTVVVDSRLPDAQACKTLAHELGHVLLHDPTDRPATLTRSWAEVEAESVAYVVTAAHGLDAADYTVPYVTGWAGGEVSVVKQTADRVLTTARQILTLTPPPSAFELPDRPARELRREHDRPARELSGWSAPERQPMGDRPNRLVSPDLQIGSGDRGDRTHNARHSEPRLGSERSSR